MAFRAPRTSPRMALDGAMDVAKDVRSRSESMLVKMSPGPISWKDVAEYHQRLIQQHTKLGTLAGVSGVVAYAKTVFDDPGYDVAAEFTAMRAAIAAAALEITNTIPGTVSANTEDGVTQTYSSASTATLQGLLSGIVATIDVSD